ncbi:GH3 auxin-responsive promoter family protein [Phaeodactylibacter luteus]|uniref:GH3 auxin-responsive promoter family protein n=1 Tax=Phaeodactylibacter luteus TaxID=1564516 RepID=A0A5C6RGB3_9BACT|nr:GH3 auxin-responsive promoter family protein [Phaeodactylibacter luteus]TXB61311.1 GH3 auxin-responsive promoter family protein [Phaeodactylibacter luteus]
MGLKSKLIKPFAKKIARDIDRWSADAVGAQREVYQKLMSKGQRTAFGKDHSLKAELPYEAFRDQVPVRDYEALKPYVERIKQGEKDVLWPGLPKYFAKTSGTTSGVKYIPLTKDSMPNHFGTARNALFNYYARTGKGHWLDGKMIFLSGSPELEQAGQIPTGRLSGIVNHEVPSWLRTNQLPTYKTNCIEDWEEKLERIIDETAKADMRLISGIPPWVQMYYERLLERTGKKTVKEVFPNFSMFVYGGVNFEPYRGALEKLVGQRLDSLETYPASEGFIAFQDDHTQPGLLLNAYSGIFFEFIPLEDIHSDAPRRLWLNEVEVGVNYALIINNNAGLWGYNIGDTVQFVSKAPYRLVVSGRVKHFISAFGEHVIGKEVEEAMNLTVAALGGKVTEFTVAPQVSPPEGGTPYHEWLIDFGERPADMAAFAKRLNEEMAQQNIYYQDLIAGHILRPLVITPLQQDAFRNYMKSQGKLGGQNKVPRLSNDRKIATQLLQWKA